MKKLFLITILMSLMLTFTVAQETVTVKGQELIIPESKEEMKQAYIEMAGLYLEAEDDLTKALENNDKLITKNKELNKLVDKAQENTQKAVDNTDTLLENQQVLIDDVNTLAEEAEYWMNQSVDPFNVTAFLLYQNDFVTYSEHEIGVGIGLEIVEKYNIQLGYLPLTGFSFSIGYQIY